MNKGALPLLFVFFLVAIIFSGCTEQDSSKEGNSSGIANPASVYCENVSGKVIIGICEAVGSFSEGWSDAEGNFIQFGKCDVEGSQAGFCRKDNEDCSEEEHAQNGCFEYKYCEEWAYYRGECEL